jgi:two-component system LytT family response regulator
MDAVKPLGAVLVDDEALARDLLREHLARHPDVAILAECANGLEAVKAISELSPDLVFLDIRMPGLDGFEVLELLPKRADGGPAVVFVTAYDEFALKAFDANAVDYLLKPFDRARFEAALERARLRRRGPSAAAVAAAAARGPGPLSRVVVKDGATITILPVATIDWIKAEDDYVLLRANGRNHLKQETLANLEAQLPPERFVRIHRSYLLALDRLDRLRPTSTGGQEALLADGTVLPVSRAGARLLRERLDGVARG